MIRGNNQSAHSVASLKKKKLDDDDQYSGFSSSYRAEDSDFEKESVAVVLNFNTAAADKQKNQNKLLGDFVKVQNDENL